MLAPYDAVGLRSCPTVHTTMVDREPFHARLRLSGREYGRSARRYTWEDLDTAATYPMFLTDLEELLNESTVRKGVAAGKWDVVKRGANYGIRLVG